MLARLQITPAEIKSLRRSRGESVEVFGERFARCGREVNDWEQGRRQPDQFVIRAMRAMIAAGHREPILGH